MYCIILFLVQYDSYIAIHPEVIVLTYLHRIAKQYTMTVLFKTWFSRHEGRLSFKERAVSVIFPIRTVEMSETAVTP